MKIYTLTVSTCSCDEHNVTTLVYPVEFFEVAKSYYDKRIKFLKEECFYKKETIIPNTYFEFKSADQDGNNSTVIILEQQELITK